MQMSKSLFIALVATTSFLSACGANENPSSPANIFGPDNRESVDSSTKPYSAVGRLDSGCTGTLIGHKLVLTAAHCLIDNATGAVKADVKYFRPAFANGTSSAAFWIDYMWLGSDKPEDNRTKDWAVIRLDGKAGDTYGTWGLQEVDFAAGLPYTVSLVGYSSDRDQAKSASVHRGCYVHEVSEGRLFHDCDATAGVSGGPLFKTISNVTHIVGITVSEFRRGNAGSVQRDGYESDYANVGVPAQEFAAVARTLLQTIDVDIAAPRQDGVIERTNPNTRDDTQPENPNDPNNPNTPGDRNRPWENDYQQFDLVSVASLAQHSQTIFNLTAALRSEAKALEYIANQYRDHTLTILVSGIRQAVGEIDYLVDNVRRGHIVSNLGQSLFYDYRLLNEQEATLYEYTGWQAQSGLQMQIDGRRTRISQLVRSYEQQIFSR